MKALFKRFLEMLRKFGIMRKTCGSDGKQKLPPHGSASTQKMGVSSSQDMTASRASQSKNDLAITPLIYAAPSIADIKRDANSRAYNNCYDNGSDYSSSSSSLSDD